MRVVSSFLFAVLEVPSLIRYNRSSFQRNVLLLNLIKSYSSAWGWRNGSVGKALVT